MIATLMLMDVTATLTRVTLRYKHDELKHSLDTRAGTTCNPS